MPRIVRETLGSPGAGHHVTDDGEWVVTVDSETLVPRRLVAMLLHQAQGDSRLAHLGTRPPATPASVQDTLTQWVQAWATRDPAGSPWPDDPEGALHLYGAIARTLAVIPELDSVSADTILRVFAHELAPTS